VFVAGTASSRRGLPMSIVLLDVDGVLADFTGHLTTLINASFKSQLNPQTYTEWDFLQSHLSEEQRKFAHDVLADGLFWRNQPVMPGARQAVERIRNAGHEIHFVTNRWFGCRDWIDARTDWLKSNMDASHKHIHAAGEKYLYRGHVFVDDKPDHVIAWTGFQERYKSLHPTKALLFDAIYNRKASYDDRLYSWYDEEGLDLILQTAAENP